MATNADVVEMNNRLYAECVAHENTKARLAEARRLYVATSMKLTSAYESMKRMADVLDSIDPETCACCDAHDAAYSDGYDDYTGPAYPNLQPLDDDPVFYACPERGVARNTAELLEMIDEEENEEYDRDEY